MKSMQIGAINLAEYFSRQAKIKRIPVINSPTTRVYRFLDRQLIVMRDIPRVKRVINQLLKDGPQNLQILADFDFTLTRYRSFGRHSRSTFSVWNESPLNDASAKASYCYSQIIKKRLNVDEQISIENPKYNVASIEQWYLFLSEILTKQNLLVSDYNKATKELMYIILRYGIEDIIHYMTKHPTLILSAGCYDLIYGVLEKYLKEEIMNINIMSNKVRVEDGVIKGFEDPLITHIAKREVCRKMMRRKNTLLFGDQISDLYMTEGRDPEHSLSICTQIGTFDIAKLYANYDIVLFSDPSLTIHNFILRLINNEVNAKVVDDMKAIGGEQFMKMCYNLPNCRSKFPAN